GVFSRRLCLGGCLLAAKEGISVTKILAIAAREYVAVVRSKAFVITLVLLPVMMFSSMLVQKLSMKVHDVNDRRFAIVDRTPGAVIYPWLAREVERFNKFVAIDPKTGQQVKSKFVLEKIDPDQTPDAIEKQQLELSARVKRGELFG